jgi:predicted GH43/DUF377 family glycosyl hydrolase
MRHTAVKGPCRSYVPELGQDIPYVFTTRSRGGMSGLFTSKMLYEQHGDADKAAFPYDYTFTLDSDTLRSCYGAADTNMAMATASVGTNLQ